MPKAAIYEFKEFRETRGRQRPNTVECYCRAAQVGRDFIWKEVEDFRATLDEPAVLDLDSCNETALLARQPSGAWSTDEPAVHQRGEDSRRASNRQAPRSAPGDYLGAQRPLRAARDQQRNFAGPPHSESVLRVSSIELGNGSGAWDMIYSTRLLSGLRKPRARKVVQSAASRLTPGGRLLLANVSPSAEVQACRLCSHPATNFRTELDLAELTRGIPDHSIAAQAVFSDEFKLNVYLELHAR